MKRMFLVLLLSSPLAGYGQCSVCTKASADQDQKVAKGMNKGILYLAAVPLGLIGTIGLIWWRKGK